MEDAEDTAVAREALAELEAAGGGPDRAEWLRLGDVAEAWPRISRSSASVPPAPK